jgi:hypothetical protein
MFALLENFKKSQIQCDRKVAQPILKYLLMFAIRYISIRLINTQYRSDSTEPTQATSSCNLLASIFRLSSGSSRMSFSQVQHVFIAEHYPASHSYLICQNECTDTFPYPVVPNRSPVFRLMDRDTGNVQERNRSGRTSVLNDDSLDDVRRTLLSSFHKSLREHSLQSGAWLFSHSM